VLRAARGHGIAQHAPRQGSNAVRGFVPAARLDTPKHNQQLLRRDQRRGYPKTPKDGFGRP